MTREVDLHILLFTRAELVDWCLEEPIRRSMRCGACEGERLETEIVGLLSFQGLSSCLHEESSSNSIWLILAISIFRTSSALYPRTPPPESN